MAFDFPSSPNLGDQYTSGGVTYEWNGYAWDSVGGGGSGVGNALVPTDDLPPIAPLDGQLWWKSNSGAFYIWYDDGSSQQWVQVSASPLMIDENYTRKTALTKNYLLNPAMQVTQETTKGTSMTANLGYPADGWKVGFSNAGTCAYALSGDNTQVDNQLGYIRLNSTVADATLGATDYYGLLQVIEGTMVEPLQLGTPFADPLVLRFNARASIAGTFSVNLRNYAGTYGWTRNLTIAQPMVWQTFELAIPPATGGTWVLTNAGSMILAFYTMLGSDFTGPPYDGWTAANVLGHTGMTNWMAVAGQYLEIASVGLYADPYNSGKAPPFEIPNYADELVRCRRYLQTCYLMFNGDVVATRAYNGIGAVQTQMRTTPVFTGSNVYSVSFPTAVGTPGLGGGNQMYEQRAATVTGASMFTSLWKLDARL